MDRIQVLIWDGSKRGESESEMQKGMVF